MVLGVPPFSVQAASALEEGAWRDLIEDAVSPASLPADGPARFFRVVGR